ncbi:MAG: VanZ family protein [Schlesneria sp.]
MSNSSAPVSSQSDSDQPKTSLATRVVLLMLCVYWGALFYGTHTKVPDGLLPGNSDKFVHFWAYAGLAILFMSLRVTQGAYTWSSVLIAWIILAFYGAFDELTQLLVARDADIFDWIFDVTGAAAGLTLVKLCVWYFRQHLRVIQR